MKIQLISFLRGYSIFTIVMMHLLMLFHFPGILGKAIMFGGAGVHVFFLCSGFGLYLSHLRKPLSYGAFLKKRFTKVYWSYAVAVLLWSVWIFAKSGQFPLLEACSHIFLWKMFSPSMDVSLCYPYWFISTIFQFYFCWPIIVKIAERRYGLVAAIAVSLSWSTLVAILGFEDLRPWGSCFLQYLWEFVLGMYIAKWSFKNDLDTFVKKMDTFAIVGCAFVGLGLNAWMTSFGSWLKVYNDIPSLLGYISCALLLYKMSWSAVIRFFCWIDSFSYELYLMHSLAFSIVIYVLKDHMSLSFIAPICIIVALLWAMIFVRILKKLY